MWGEDADVLQTAVTKFTDWRNQGLTVNVDIQQYSTRINGQPVVFSWNEGRAGWDVTAL